MEGQVYGYDENFNKAPMTPQDNLLTNSDFSSGIINQKGQTSYNTVNKYTIDMWMLFKASTSVTVNDGYITTNANLLQYIDIPLEAGDYTVAVKVGSNIRTYTFKNFTGARMSQNLEDIGFSIAYDNPRNKLVFELYALNQNRNIYFVKLEKGSHFTGMPKWDQILEEYKCYTRLTKIFGLRLPCCEKNNVTNGKQFSFSIPRSQIMVDTPSVSVIGITTMNSLNGICMRNSKDVSSIINMKSYEFEVRPYEILVRCYVDNSVDVPNIDVQLYISDNFTILLDANSY